MAKFNFGFTAQHFNNATPESVSNTVGVFTAIFAVVVATVSQDKHISPAFKEEFALYGGLLTAIANTLRPFFSVPASAAAIEEVTK